MSNRVGGIFADLSLRTKEFAAGLRNATQKTQQAGKKMQESMGDKPQKGLEDTEKKAAKVTWAMRGYIKDTFRVVSGILISQAFYTILRYLRQMISEAMVLKQTFEEAALSFQYLVDQGADDARWMAHEMRYWALDTEYSIAQVTDAFQQMIVAGLGMHEIEDSMQIILGTASATRTNLNELLGVMRRIRATPVLDTSTLRSLERAGIEIAPIFREQLGLTNEELDDLNSLNISGEKAFRALLAGFKDYADAATDFADTVAALRSDLWELMTDTLGVLMDERFRQFRDWLRDAVGWMTAFRQGVMEMGPAFILELFPPDIAESIATIAAALNGLLQNIIRIIAAFSDLYRAGMRYFIGIFSTLLPIVTQTVGALADFVEYVINAIPAIRQLASALLSLFVMGTLAIWVKALAVGFANLIKLTYALSKSFKFLVAVMTWMVKHPVVAYFTMLGGLLLALTGQLNRVREFASRMGVAVRDAFDMFPERTYLEDADEGLGNLGDGFERIEDQAEDAADAMDPFLAAFDEVYEIPEPSDDEEDRDFPMPDIPEVEIPTEIPEFEDIAFDVDGMTEEMEGSFNNFLDFFEEWGSTWRGKATAIIGSLIWLFKNKIRNLLTITIPNLIRNAIPFIRAGFMELVRSLQRYFLGIFRNIIPWLSNNLLKPIKGFFTKTLGPILKKAALWIAKGIVAKFGAIPALIAAGLVGLAYIIYEWGEDILEWMKENLWEPLVDGFDWVTGRIGDFWECLKDLLSPVFDWVTGRIGDFWAWLKDLLSPVFDWIYTNVIEPLSPAFERMFDNIGAFLGTFYDIWEYVWEDVKTIVGGVWHFLTEYLPENWRKILDWAVEIWEDGIAALFKWLHDNIWEPLVDTWEWIKDRLSDFWNWLGDVATDVWEGIIRPIFEWLRENIWEPLVSIWEWIRDRLVAIWHEIKDLAMEIWDNYLADIFKWLQENIWEPLVDTWEWIEERLSSIWNGIKDVAETVWDGITDAVTTSINSIIRGINRMIRAWNNIELTMPSASLPDALGGGEIGGWSVGTRDMRKIPELKKGGIITKDMIYRGGEGNNAEGVIPLQSGAADPFIEKLASKIAEHTGSGNSGRETPVYVGTLIADKRGLKELERRLGKVREAEGYRTANKGGGVIG